MKSSTVRWKFLFLSLVCLGFIYATLPFARSLVNILYQVEGVAWWRRVANLFLGLSFGWFLFVALRSRGIKAVGILLAGASLLFYGWHLSRPVEKVHLLEYAILGSLWERSFSGTWGWLLALVAVSLSGIVDETIQYFLPNRVFDVRDIFMNVISGVYGVWFARFWFSSS